MGVMLGMLSGNKETVETHLAAKGKIIKKALLADDALTLHFTDDTAILFRDDGQSCCERRYMQTDDDLASYIGATFVGAELREAPTVEAEYDTHEVQFLVILTDRGNLTMASHNEHNGYYGGFHIVIEAA